ncbi:MAG TPA: CHAT domain-containing protein [Thermoanaerobaculia bacterium]
MPRVVSFLAVLLVAAASFASDSPLPAAQDFWDAYARGDVAGAVSVWQPARVQRFEAVFRRETELRCMRVLQSSLRLSLEQAARAKVDVDAFVEVRGVVEEEHHLIDLRLAESRWQVAGFHRREDLLADELVRTPAAGRAALLEANRALATPRLAVALSRSAILLASRQRDTEALEMLAIARDVAGFTASDVALSAILAAESVHRRRNAAPGDKLAIEIGEEAERVALRSGDPDAVARARIRLARALDGVDTPRAEALVAGVVDSADTLFDTATIATAATQLAWTYGNRLDHSASFRFALLASHYADLSGDLSARLNAALNVAGVYDYAGDFELSRLHNQRVVELARESGAAIAEIVALSRTAEMSPDGGVDPAVIARIRELADCTGDPGQAYALTLRLNRAETAVQRKAPAAARANLAGVYDLLTRIAIEPVIHVRILGVEAGLLIEEGEPVKALEVIEEGRAFLTTLPEWISLQWLSGMAAKALRMLGRRDEAIAELRRGIEYVQLGRTTLPGEPRARQSYFRHRTSLYDTLVDVLVEAGDPAEALAVADQRTARTLTDFARVPAPAAGVHSPEIDRAERAVVELNRAILAARPDDPSVLRNRQRLVEARLRLDDLRIRSAADRGPIPEDTAVAAIDLSKVAPRTAIVRYVVADEQTIAFVITNGEGRPAVTAHRLAVRRADLEKRVQALLGRIVARDGAYRKPARALHALLFAPLLGDLRGFERVTVVPDGPLGALPFQTLIDAQGRHVLTRFELHYAPSLAWCLRDSGPSPRARSILTVGDPQIGGAGQAMFRSLVPGSELGQLPDAAREAREVARLYPRSRVLTGSAADESVLKEELPRYDVVHLATHALIDESQPLYSSLVLAARGPREDGLLEARELHSLDLAARLFVLSACSTARGRNYGGEGVVGLAWALLSRGVPQVVVSQWNADSKATRRLMVLFHRALVAGEPPAAALRKAQLELRRDVRYEDPLYWAPFVVLGS